LTTECTEATETRNLNQGSINAGVRDRQKKFTSFRVPLKFLFFVRLCVLRVLRGKSLPLNLVANLCSFINETALDLQGSNPILT
jgi:hypothetical protein